jgi:O-antigen chain-terminating methyltransferase
MHAPDTRDRDIARRYFQPFLKYFSACRSVVDVASGQGHFLEILREAGIPATGIEIDPALCALCRQKGLKITEADFFNHLPILPPGAFDGAILSHIVEHFLPVQVDTLLRRLRPALQPGSPLLILTPNIANLRRAVGDFWRDPTHVRPYPIPALSILLRGAGWEIAESGECTDRKPSLRRSISYALRNTLIGRYWVGDDVFVVARGDNVPGKRAP